MPDTIACITPRTYIAFQFISMPFNRRSHGYRIFHLAYRFVRQVSFLYFFSIRTISLYTPCSRSKCVLNIVTCHVLTCFELTHRCCLRTVAQFRQLFIIIFVSISARLYVGIDIFAFQGFVRRLVVNLEVLRIHVQAGRRSMLTRVRSHSS